ncbi:unnamed protein product [Lactuca saligna]|uniref:Uncharacterized protein n=1 Tax=Lactuca saligna TaxID=75948 RepID=A0AA35V203_LACSI|nr:unnamed protein product [Lactuca saligna]
MPPSLLTRLALSSQKTVMPTPKEVDKEGFQTVKRKTRDFPLPKKMIQVDNRKDKGPALNIAQVYKPIIHDPSKKNVSANMFDPLMHQRVDDSQVYSCIPNVIHSRDAHPTTIAHTSSSHGGRISSLIN